MHIIVTVAVLGPAPLEPVVAMLQSARPDFDLLGHSLTLYESFHWDYLLHRDYGLCPALRVLCTEARGLTALTSAYHVGFGAMVLSRWFGVRLHMVL